MKRFLNIIVVALILSSCDGFDLEEQGIVLTEVPSYVAFATAGGTVVPINLTVSESATAASSLRIECATGTLSDITVTYSFSGSAVYNQDFEVVPTTGGSSTATGGTIVIRKNTSPSGVADFDFVSLQIRPLRGTVGDADGNKQLVIRLESAVNADGKVFQVGRGLEGGTIYMREATINYTDVD